MEDGGKRHVKKDGKCNRAQGDIKTVWRQCVLERGERRGEVMGNVGLIQKRKPAIPIYCVLYFILHQ